MARMHLEALEKAIQRFEAARHRLWVTNPWEKSSITMQLWIAAGSRLRQPDLNLQTSMHKWRTCYLDVCTICRIGGVEILRDSKNDRQRGHEDYAGAADLARKALSSIRIAGR